MKDSGETQITNEISFLVSKNEFRLLRVALLLELEQEVFLKRAQAEKSRYRLKFSFKQLKGFLECLVEMDWFLKKEQHKKRLKKLVNKLNGYLSLAFLLPEFGKTVQPASRKPCL